MARIRSRLLLRGDLLPAWRLLACWGFRWSLLSGRLYLLLPELHALSRLCRCRRRRFPDNSGLLLSRLHALNGAWRIMSMNTSRWRERSHYIAIPFDSSRHWMVPTHDATAP